MRLLPASLLSSVFALTSVSCTETPRVFKDVDFDVAGTVRAEGSNEPLADAQVAMVYRTPGEDRENPGYGPTSECAKVKGARTDSQGRFLFKAEKLDAMIPFQVLAIKPGYFTGSLRLATPAYRANRGDVDLALAQRATYEQDSSASTSQRRDKVEYEYQIITSVDCWKASRGQDVVGSISFLEALRESAQPYYAAGRGASRGRELEERIAQSIATMKAMP